MESLKQRLQYAKSIKINRNFSIYLPRRHHLLSKEHENISVKLIKSQSSLNLPIYYIPKDHKTITLKKISDQIAFIPNKSEKDKNKNHVGGLYSLFFSNVFDVNLLLYYLDMKDENSIIDSLIHLLNEKFTNQINAYVPQLIALYLSKKTSLSIEDCLLRNSLRSIVFCLKIRWVMNNYCSKVIEKKGGKCMKRLQNLIQYKIIEERRHAVCTYAITYDYKNYYERINGFYEGLHSINMIKAKTIDDYLSEVKKIVIKLNKMIESMRIIALKEGKQEMTQEINNLYHGFVFPINSRMDTIDDQKNYAIVNILPDQITMCYSHNSYAKSNSYALKFECIEVNDCDKWEEIILPIPDKKEDFKEAETK